jgi:hypothetical protein
MSTFVAASTMVGSWKNKKEKKEYQVANKFKADKISKNHIFKISQISNNSFK